MTNTKQKQRIKYDIDLDTIASLVMTNTKRKQRVKYDIDLDTIARECPTRKIFLKLFVCTESFSLSLSLTLFISFHLLMIRWPESVEYVRQPPLPRIMDLLLLWALPSFLTSLHSVFHKRSGLLVSFDCFDNCCRERGEREREREMELLLHAAVV